MPTKKSKPSAPVAEPTPLTIPDLIILSHSGIQIKGEDLARMTTHYALKRMERLIADKTAAKLKDEENAAAACLIEQLRAQKIQAVGGDRVTVALNETEEPVVKDWQLFYAHILATQDFSFLERRPGRAAIKERWANSGDVAGIDKFPVYKLSVSKVK